LILHGDGRVRKQFLTPKFGGVVFGPVNFWMQASISSVLPDNIGHGDSSKPSDGLHMRVPH